MRVAVVGGGAAGFFSAIQVKSNYPDASVTIFEKSNKVLSKVKVSGGGRCNVTNGCQSIPELIKGYPRGANKLKKLFREFNNTDIQQWFDDRGVSLKTESDGRVFPVLNSSQTIIDCFLEEVDSLGIEVRKGVGVSGIRCEPNLSLEIDGEWSDYDKVILSTGGSPKRSGLQWLEKLGHKIEEPVPSLFTFNIPNDPIKKLQGTVCANAQVSIQSSKLRSQGPLLITHWGMSGPAILKLSAFGARELADKQYDFKVQVSWVGDVNFDQASGELNDAARQSPNKQLGNYKPFGLTEKLWLFIVDKSGLPKDKKWSELGKKGINKLVNLLTNDVYQVSGKTTFKEEFVTCGGVSWDSINPKTMQSKAVPGLYFAGELVDVDGITGGYNFQAAWTTGYVAAKLSD